MYTQRTTPSWLAFTLLMLACSEQPAAPRQWITQPEVVHITTPIVCESNWLYMRDGDWNDPSNWLPSAVPTSSDEVCITGAGTYTITLDSISRADSVFVGPGVNVSFVGSSDTRLDVSEEIVVAAGASLTMEDSALFFTRDLINDGSFAVRDHAYFSASGRLENRAYMELETDRTVDVANLVNTGDLRVESDETIRCSGLCQFAAGRVLGPGTLRVTSSWSTASIVWSGGVLGMRGSDANAAQVTIDGVSLTLANTALVGAIDMEADRDTLFGDIGSAVSVKLWSNTAKVVEFSPLVGSPPGTPMVNHGTLLVDRSGTLATATQTISSSGTFENRGDFRVLGTTARIITDAFDNRGTVRLQDDLWLGSAASPTVTRNFGTIDVASGATLALRDGTFIATTSGRQTGRFRLDGGILTGGGHTGDVQAVAGTIAPGPGIQTLGFDRLVLTPNTLLQMEVGGPLVMDRLRVLGEATYSGTLEITSLGAYVGGVCGQVLPMFTDGNSATAHAPGAFQYFGNIPGGLGRFWRAHYATDSVLVTGYDPSRLMSTTVSTGVLAEGGPAATGNVCLGAPLAAGTVIATLTAARGQFTAAPTPMTFTSSNFALPQPVRYTAVDDALSEGLHSDTLLFALTRGGLPFGSTPPGVPFGIVDNDPPVDLALSIVSAPSSVAVGNFVETRYRITNLGPGASTGSSFSIPVLAGLTFASSGAGTSCSVTAGTLSCTIAAIAAGGSTDLPVLFTATAVGSWNNTLRIRGNDWDNVTANNTLAWLLDVF